jgi:hypothetical protein
MGALVTLFFVYAVIVPAYAVFWAEGRRMEAAVLVAACVSFGALVFAVRYRSLTEPGPSSQARKLANYLRTLRPLRRFMRAADELEPLPATGSAGRTSEFIGSLWKKTFPDRSLPPIYWYLRDGCAARVVGSSAKPALAVSSGFIRAVRDGGDAPRIVMLHEFAHVFHGDATLSALARSLLVAWPLAATSAGLGCLVPLLLAADQPIYVALVLTVATLWAFTLLLAYVFLLRYAGFFYSLRELHADVAAAAWLRDASAFERGLAGARLHEGQRASWRSLFGLTLTHLSGAERLELLQEPARLILPKLRYFALSGALAIFVQSSPFLGSFGNVGMILFVAVFGWAISATLLTNSTFALFYSAIGPVPFSFRQRLVLVASLAFFLHLPFMSVADLLEMSK